MDKITRIGMDTSKQFFQLHGVNAAEQPVLRKKLKRKDVLTFFSQLDPCVVAIEACGASHYWARELTKLGHTVKMIAPQLVKPYVKRGKNDATDAEALCEAASRPTMRFVPVKTADQQADLMLGAQRERLVRQRTQLTNAIRGHAAEFGLTERQGIRQVKLLLETIAADESVPARARELFAEHAAELTALQAKIDAIDVRLKNWFKNNELAKRLAEIPSVGQVIATTAVMKTPDPGAFKCGRDYAASLGLTPKDHSTAGKVRQGGITRAGDETMRALLVEGAMAVIRHARSSKDPMPWLVNLLQRKPIKLVAIALANKTARTIWKLMVSGEKYDRTRARPTLQSA